MKCKEGEVGGRNNLVEEAGARQVDEWNFQVHSILKLNFQVCNKDSRFVAPRPTTEQRRKILSPYFFTGLEKSG